MIAAALAILAASPPATSGQCAFDRASLSFAGTPREQAQCLLRHVGIGGRIDPQPLPTAILDRVGLPFDPGRGRLKALIRSLAPTAARDLLHHVGGPSSTTEAGIPAAYFVIHDTSTPYLGDDPFPANLDADARVNNFAPYRTAEPVAHLFVDRRGKVMVGHDFGEGWRATKLESRIIGVPARGRFLHVELIQPRRRDPADANSTNDRLAPDQGFGEGQYRALVAAYLVASARAGHWLVPAFHATIDEGIAHAHDDPQRFDLNRFGALLAWAAAQL